MTEHMLTYIGCLVIYLTNFIFCFLILLAFESVNGNGGRRMFRYLFFPEVATWFSLVCLQIFWLITKDYSFFAAPYLGIVGLVNLFSLVSFLSYCRHQHQKEEIET